MSTTYEVVGRWPFPLDMLRYDSSSAASPEDQQKIDTFSVESPDSAEILHKKVSIFLITELKPHHLATHAPRWESFGWMIVGCQKPPIAL